MNLDRSIRYFKNIKIVTGYISAQKEKVIGIILEKPRELKKKKELAREHYFLNHLDKYLIDYIDKCIISAFNHSEGKVFVLPTDGSGLLDMFNFKYHIRIDKALERIAKQSKLDYLITRMKVHQEVGTNKSFNDLCSELLTKVYDHYLTEPQIEVSLKTFTHHWANIDIWEYLKIEVK